MVMHFGMDTSYNIKMSVTSDIMDISGAVVESDALLGYAPAGNTPKMSLVFTKKPYIIEIK